MNREDSKYEFDIEIDAPPREGNYEVAVGAITADGAGYFALENTHKLTTVAK